MSWVSISPLLCSLSPGKKSQGMRNLRWVQDDMRSFELDVRFSLAIIPGHSFQNILTAEDQVVTLDAIKRHLVPAGEALAQPPNRLSVVRCGRQ